MALALCQKDSSLQSCSSKVLVCEAYNHEISKGSEDVDKSLIPFWRVQVSETVLFPEGGGQPSDTGTLDDRVVSDVQRDDEGNIWHFINGAESIPVGKMVQLKVDWIRREDHMHQHSAQHLISAVLSRSSAYEHAKTLSWYLTPFPRPSIIDIGVKSFTEAQLGQLESEVNQNIRKNLEVKIHEFGNAEELAPVVEKVKGGSSYDFSSGSPLRVIEMSGLDFNPCCGTHVKSTGDIQLVKFVSIQKAKGHIQISFLAASRCISALSTMFTREKRLTDLLSSPPEAHIEQVTRLKSGFKAQGKLCDSILLELSAHIATRLAKEFESNGHVAFFHRDDANLAFLQNVAKECLKLSPNAFIILTASENEIAGSGKSGVVLIRGPDSELVTETGKFMTQSTMLDGRGGGRKGTFQGKVNQIKNVKLVIEKLLEQSFFSKIIEK